MSGANDPFFPVPKPAPDAIRRDTVAFFDALAQDYDAFDAGMDRRARYTAAIDRLVADTLKAQGARDLISFACGTGRREAAIRDRAGLTGPVVGVEPSPAMADRARARGIAVVDDPAAAPPGAFDAAIVLYSLGVFADRAARLDILGHIRRALRPGGMFLFDAFNMDDRNDWGGLIAENFARGDLGAQGYDLGDVFYRRKSGTPGQGFVHYFSEAELRGLLAAAGFARVKIRQIGYKARIGTVDVGAREGKHFCLCRAAPRDGAI